MQKQTRERDNADTEDLLFMETQQAFFFFFLSCDQLPMFSRILSYCQEEKITKIHMSIFYHGASFCGWPSTKRE